VLIFSANGLEGRARICAHDLDGTIIKTRSGATFPKSKDDWQFWNDAVPEKLRRMHFCDSKLSVFSNQLGAGNGRVDLEAFKSKIEDICNAVAIPMQFFISTSEGFYRKPKVGMWRLLKESENDYEEVSNEHSFYVGDAAGRSANASRPADHSNSDELFAANAGLSFFTPDAFFRVRSYTKYTQERQVELDHLDGKRQSVSAIHAANGKAHEAYASGRDSENARGGHSDDTTSPVSGEDSRRLMKLLDRVEGTLIRNGDAQLEGSGSDSDSGIDSTLIRMLGGASYYGRDLRRSENLPHKVTLELKLEIAAQLRELIRGGPVTPDRRTEAETEHRHRTANDRHTSP